MSPCFPCQNNSAGQQGHDACYNGSFFHNIFSFLLLKSDQGRKGEEKFTAFSFLAFDSDISAVRENNFPRNAKAQAGSLITAFRSAEKLIEDAAT